MVALEKLEIKKQVLAILIILIAAFTIRLSLYTGMIRSDDFQYAHAAFELSNGYTNFDGWEGNARIGFYGPVALLYRLFGANNVTTLILPLFCSLLSILFIYGMGYLLWDESAGLLGALIWALLPYDIFLATDLLPDVPQAAFNAGVVFFLLLSEKTQNRKRYIYYVITCILLIWSFFIKEPSIIVLFFVIAYIFYKTIRKYKESITNNNIIRKILNHPSAISIFCLIIFSILFLYYASCQHSIQHFLTLLTDTSTNLAQLITDHISYHHLAPLFFVSFSSILLSKNEKDSNIFILLWIAVVYLYYEWGTIRINSLYYDTIDMYADARYALFVFTPISIFSGRYISQSFSINTCRIITIIVGLLTVFLSIMYHSITGGQSDFILFLSIQSVYLLILTSILSPIVFLFPIKKIFKKIFLLTLVALISISTFSVTNSLLNLYNDLRFPMQNLTKVGQFIKTQPKAPVIVLSKQNALALNYYSGFELGYNPFEENGEGQFIHRTSYESLTNIKIRCYLLLDGTDDHSKVPSGWKKKVEFIHTIPESGALSGVSHVIYIY